MAAYIIRRLLLMIPTLLGIMIINFGVIQFLPGGPVEQVLAELSGQATGATDRFTGGTGSDFQGANPSQGGAGGAVNSKYRGAQGLDPETYRVLPFAAPTPNERAHHYLWRFWEKLPSPGRVVIFDRSLYGRVLVELVEGFATEEQWTRSYGEINDMERAWTNSGMRVVKFWLLSRSAS